MEQYIDKSALIAEIEKRRSEYINSLMTEQVHTLSDILDFIDTLEVKEVGNVWHDASETPKGAGDNEILVQFADFHASVLEIDDWEYLDHQTKWAYLKDLT
jgi:hypothetical protein